MIKKQIYIKTTEQCHMRCQHCYIGDARKNLDFFDEVKTIKWVKELIEYEKLKEEEILFTFHGGEPFLCPLWKMETFCNAFPNAMFNATTNLCYRLSDEILTFMKKWFYDKDLKKHFIKTSYDEGDIRFPRGLGLDVWKYNLGRLQEEGFDVRVIICVTSHLIKLNPIKFLHTLLSMNITNINFERLTDNTTVDKTLIPDYNKMDDWLFEFYVVNKAFGNIQVAMFEELKQAFDGVYTNCRKRKCMSEVLTINADGTIGGCPNTSLVDYFTTINNSIPDVDNICHSCLIKKEEEQREECLCCELFKFCNGDCHQLSWKDGRCATPKKIIKSFIDYKKIQEDITPKLDEFFLEIKPMERLTGEIVKITPRYVDRDEIK